MDVVTLGAAKSFSKKGQSRAIGDNTMSLFGDSITDFYQTYTTGTPTVLYTQGVSFHRQMQMFARNRFRITAEYGVAGDTMAQILARVGAVIADPARNVFFHGGINSITADVSAATIIADNKLIWDALQAAGKRVIQPTIMNARQIVTTAQRQQYDKVNAWIMSEGPKRGIIVIPWHHLWTDPVDGRPHGPSQSAPWVTIDGTHPSSYGAALMGKFAAQFLAPLFPDAGHQLTYTNADSTNAIPNGLMLNTAGTGQLNGATNTAVADGWKVTTSVSQVATPSIIASTDGLGNWQQMRVTAGTFNSGSCTLTYDAPTASSWAVGDTVVARVEIDTDADFVNATRLDMSLVALTGGYATLYTGQALRDTSATQDIYRTQVTNGVLETPPFVVPATAGILQFRLAIAGLNGINGSTATLRARRASISRVPTP